MILSEKHLIWQKTFRDFAESEFTQALTDKLDETGGFNWDIYNKMAKAGFMGVKIPTEYGGQGADTLTYVLMMEEFARVSPVLSLYANTSNSLGAGPLLHCANEEQLKKYLPDIASGKKLLSFCLTEPDAGSDAGGIITSAADCGDHYLLNGKKRFASGAPVADYALVFARTASAQHGNRGISLFIVDMRLDGVSCGVCEDKMGIRGYPTSDIFFTNVRVPKDCLLGPLHGGYAAAIKTLDGGRLGIAAQALGIAQGCLDEAVAYAKQRKQFGAPIGKFEGVSFMLADMATELRAARELVYSTAVLKDTGSPDANMHCAMSKYYASEMCNRVAYKAVQIFGGYGYIRSSKVERLYRDARITSIYEGTSQIQQMVIANNLLRQKITQAPSPTQNGNGARILGGTAAEMGEALISLLDKAELMPTHCPSAQNLDNAKILVAVGMGIKEDSATGIALANELAELLGGTVGCTRDVVCAGWLDKSRMIGQTGKTVRPKLYIALGVSGAVHHLCGIKESGCIVSVNRDANAPINDISDIVLTGDLFDIVPAIITVLKDK